MSRGGGRGASHVGGRGGGRGGKQAIARGGMSRVGKRRSPRTSKKKTTTELVPSGNVPDDNEGDRPSSQEPNLRSPRSLYVHNRRTEDDVDDRDSMLTASQTVNNKEKRLSPSDEQVGNERAIRTQANPSSTNESEDRIEKVLPKKSMTPVKGRSTGHDGKNMNKQSKSGQDSHKRSFSEGTGRERDAVKKRRVNEGQELSQVNRGSMREHVGSGQHVATTSAKSGQSGRLPPRSVSNRDPPSASMNKGQYVEMLNMLHDLKTQNQNVIELLQTLVKKLDSQPEIHPSSQVKQEVLEVPVTPKRQYEDIMYYRMSQIDGVFNDDNFSLSAMKIIPRYIINLVDRRQNRIPIEKVPRLLNSLLFSVPREMKGPSNATDEGAACSFLRRNIIIDCYRNGPKVLSHLPQWLSSKKVGDRRVSYLDEKDLAIGFDRRERCRGRNVDSDSKRRRSIADGKIQPTPTDDAEYIGWWAYGQLGSFFNKCRRNAIALLFENVTYLFVPWCWSTIDRRSSDGVGKPVSSENGNPKETRIDDIISKKSLRIEWVTECSLTNVQSKSIPMSKITGDDEECDKANHRIFTAIAKREENLQVNVEHDVLVHKSTASKGIRQRKGEVVKTFTRRISLMDGAAQFLIGLTGGCRTMSSHELMKFNRKSLEAIIYLASAFRDIMEHATIDVMRGPYGAIANPCTKISTEIAKEMKDMFTKMTPNDQIQGRVFNRMIWSVQEDIYKSQHCYKLMNAVDDNDEEHIDEEQDEEDADKEYLLEDDQESDGQLEEFEVEDLLEDDRLNSQGYVSKSVTVAPRGVSAMAPSPDLEDEDDMAGDPLGERQDEKEESDGDGEIDMDNLESERDSS